MAKVSVIIPIYNAERHINNCLDSVLGQTLTDIEVVCVNDGSTDGTLRILTELQKHDCRIKIISEENGGAGVAQRNGLSAASGEYVCFIGADDEYSNPNVLKLLYDSAIGNGVSVACGRMELLLPSGRIVLATTDFGQCHESGLYIYQDNPHDWGYTCCIFQRKMLIKNQITFPVWRRNQDPPFFIKAMCAARRFYYIDRPVYRYRTGYKKVDWKSDGYARMLDMLRGVYQELEISHEYALNKLEAMLLDRMNTSEYSALVQAMGASSEVLAVVRTLDAAFDRQSLRRNRNDLMTTLLPKILPLWHYEHPILRVLCFGDKGPKLFWTIRAGGFRLLMQKLWRQLVGV